MRTAWCIVVLAIGCGSKDSPTSSSDPGSAPVPGSGKTAAKTPRGTVTTTAFTRDHAASCNDIVPDALRAKFQVTAAVNADVPMHALECRYQGSGRALTVRVDCGTPGLPISGIHAHLDRKRDDAKKRELYIDDVDFGETGFHLKPDGYGNHDPGVVFIASQATCLVEVHTEKPVEVARAIEARITPASIE